MRPRPRAASALLAAKVLLPCNSRPADSPSVPRLQEGLLCSPRCPKAPSLKVTPTFNLSPQPSRQDSVEPRALPSAGHAGHSGGRRPRASNVQRPGASDASHHPGKRKAGQKAPDAPPNHCRFPSPLLFILLRM